MTTDYYLYFFLLCLLIIKLWDGQIMLQKSKLVSIHNCILGKGLFNSLLLINEPADSPEGIPWVHYASGNRVTEEDWMDSSLSFEKFTLPSSAPIVPCCSVKLWAARPGRCKVRPLSTTSWSAHWKLSQFI